MPDAEVLSTKYIFDGAGRTLGIVEHYDTGVFAPFFADGTLSHREWTYIGCNFKTQHVAIEALREAHAVRAAIGGNGE